MLINHPIYVNVTIGVTPRSKRRCMDRMGRHSLLQYLVCDASYGLHERDAMYARVHARESMHPMKCN